MNALLDKVRRGDRRSLARAMSLVDGPGPEVDDLTDQLRQATGQIPWWGLTGPPGVGKSTLIDAMLGLLRSRGHRVGVVAVDPTSPRSDGALLGDRIRMMRHAVDQDVFIRSLATHRREGGLSDATIHCARLLELAGFDPVLIETVGVGQSEVDIASVADISIVVLGPGYGDDIQVIKAGLLEIADIVVVNKCDLPEANRLLGEVRAELEFSSAVPRLGHQEVEPAHPGGDREGMPRNARGGTAPQIIGIEAKSGKRVDELLDMLFSADRAARSPEQRERHGYERATDEIRRSAMLRSERALEHELSTEAGRQLITELQKGELSLDAVVKKLGANHA